MKLILVAFFTLTAACTPYQNVGYSGGFYHTKMTDNFYIVGFIGNGFTNRSRAYGFAFMRAMEIGSELGFTHAVIEGTQDKTTSHVLDSGSTANTSGTIRQGFGNNATFNSTSRTSSNTTPYTKPGVEMGVLYSEGPPEGRHLEVIVIADALALLRAKYKITD
ncbi:hypothetical protein N9J84_01575 [Porticoccaceae bacterium]|nr:hypothetical protein [Porticoccaceae bacterium]